MAAGIATPIPTASDWTGYEANLDSTHAFQTFFGKSLAEAQQLFDCCAIELAEDLRFMPRRAFQYYILAFATFIQSPVARGCPDAASPFLRLLLAREDADPGSVAELLTELEPAISFVASSQSYFEAAEDIYGHFPTLVKQLRESCAKNTQTGA